LKKSESGGDFSVAGFGWGGDFEKVLPYFSDFLWLLKKKTFDFK